MKAEQRERQSELLWLHHARVRRAELDGPLRAVGPVRYLDRDETERYLGLWRIRRADARTLAKPTLAAVREWLSTLGGAVVYWTHPNCLETGLMEIHASCLLRGLDVALRLLGPDLFLGTLDASHGCAWDVGSEDWEETLLQLW